MFWRARLKGIVAIFLLILPFGADADIATKTYVDKSITDQVKTTGDQDISGKKTYTESPVVPTPPLP